MLHEAAFFLKCFLMFFNWDSCLARPRFIYLQGHLSCLCGELRIPHWTKQISWLASVLNVNWMPSLSLIVMPLQVYWHRMERSQSLFPSSKQTRRARWRNQRRGLWGGSWDACLIWLVLKLLRPFALCPNPNRSHQDRCPLLDEVVSILVIREVSDVDHRAVKCWCKSAHALHHTVCQVWVWLGGIHLPHNSIHQWRKWPGCW